VLMIHVMVMQWRLFPLLRSGANIWLLCINSLIACLYGVLLVLSSHEAGFTLLRY
jgi:hypothetical protein